MSAVKRCTHTVHQFGSWVTCGSIGKSFRCVSGLSLLGMRYTSLAGNQDGGDGG